MDDELERINTIGVNIGMILIALGSIVILSIPFILEFLG